MIYLIIIAVIITILFIIGFIFSGIAVLPKVMPYEDTFTRELNCGKIIKEDYKNMKKEEVNIKSPYGYNLHGMFFPMKDSKKAIIICHGITDSLFGSVKYINMYVKRGFNIFIYDHRHHGMSGGANCTFGFYEKYDLKACTDWLFNKLGSDAVIGIHGESMGAATALQNSAIDSRVAFYIADCPYSDLKSLLKYQLKKSYHLPGFPIIYISSLISKIRTGMYFGDVSPIRDIKNVSTPIFFIHGSEDNFIPNKMSRDMFEVKTNGIRKLFIAPNADHVEAYWNNKKEYEEKIDEFLREINVI